MCKNTDKFLVFLGLLNLIFFLGISLAIGELRNKDKSHDKELSDLQQAVTSDRAFFTSAVSGIHENMLKLQIVIETQEKKLLILDESIDPKDQRWALIKRVRSVVEKYAKSKMTIKDYTYIATSIVDYSEEHDVPISLVLAVAREESAFTSMIESHAGAMGIMQVMPATASDIAGELGKRNYNLYNAKNNIQLGTYYLWKMLDRFHGDMDLAVRAYNCGPVCVEKVTADLWSKRKCEWKDGTITEEEYPCETVGYHKRVMEYKREFKKIGL